MSEPVIVALIGASGAILAAVVAAVVAAVINRPRRPRLTSPPPKTVPTREPIAEAGGIERLLDTDERVQRLLNQPQWRPAAEAAMAHFVRGTPCPDEGWRRTATWTQIRAACLDHIVALLGHYRQRATYGAVAGVVGGIAQAVMRDRPVVPANSWVVRAEPPYHPSGFLPEQLDPRLAERAEVIQAGGELRDWLRDPR